MFFLKFVLKRKSQESGNFLSELITSSAITIKQKGVKAKAHVIVYGMGGRRPIGKENIVGFLFDPARERVGRIPPLGRWSLIIRLFREIAE